ncbi:uncharacterized protein LOC100175389 [Ciona intestinalis]
MTSLFLPLSCLKHESGYLVGQFVEEHNCYYVVDVKQDASFQDGGATHHIGCLGEVDLLNHEDKIRIRFDEDRVLCSSHNDVTIVVYDVDKIATSAESFNLNRTRKSGNSPYDVASVKTLFSVVSNFHKIQDGGHPTPIRPTKQNIQVLGLLNTMLSHIWKLFHPIIYLLQLSSVGSLFLQKLNVVKTRDKTQAISIFVDLLLGLLFYFIVLNNLSPISNQSFTFVPSVDYIGTQVEHLIRWLMGIPIGLKLNSNLNQFLGKFFLHHVRLWLEYIHVLSAAFWDESQPKDLLQWLLLVCCGGFSFFFAILSDLTAILSFHIYCFYVYAARLYGLQMCGLVSLGRLFRGLKHNPLRQRVDSMTQQSERLFIGTLVFTALLFLLPTTMLYYVIFAALRLVIMAIQNNLLWLRKLFGNFPLYLVYRRVRFPEEFPGRAVFTRTQQGFIQLAVHPRPYMVVLQQWVTHTMQPTISFKQLLFSLVYGSLLKWI